MFDNVLFPHLASVFASSPEVHSRDIQDRLRVVIPGEPPKMRWFDGPEKEHEGVSCLKTSKSDNDGIRHPTTRSDVFRVMKSHVCWVHQLIPLVILPR